MKILYITNNLDGKDGWSRYSLTAAMFFKDRDVLWLVADKTKNDFKQEALLLKPARYLLNIFLIFSTARKINAAIKKYSPDVIHFLVEPYLTVLPLLNVKKIKIVSTVHGTYSFLPNATKFFAAKFFLLWWMKFVYKRINNIVAISGFTKNYLFACLNRYNFKGVKEKIVVISNGIDFNGFYDWRGKKTPRKTKRILFVGAIKERKGLAEAINVLKFYRDRYSDNFVFNIVGAYNVDDQYYLRLKSLVDSYQLNKQIVFENKVEESVLRDFYAQADLFLMLPINKGSNFEGFGLVYLEANAVGAPCIGARHSGAEEAILDGKSGYLAESRSVKDAAEKIDLILNKRTINPEDCVNWAKQNDSSVKFKKLLEIYRSN